MQTTSQSETLLSAEQVADRLGVTGETVRRWCRNGDLSAVRLGESRQAPIRIREDALKRFVHPAAPEAA